MGDDDRDHQAAMRPGGTIVSVKAVLGVVALCGVVGVTAAIAIPNLLAARQRRNESAAIAGLETIANAQEMFRAGDMEHDEICDYGTLGELAAEELIDSVLANGTKQGYHFSVQPGPDRETGWWATAAPAVPGTTGSRFFYVDQTRTICIASEPIQGPLDPKRLPAGVQRQR